jgi:hypothetical protein
MAELKESFVQVLHEMFETAEKEGREFIRVTSGDLHQRVGAINRYPACCNAMRSEMQAADIIISSPPKGDGASLVIEYKLPRGKK